MDCKFSPYRILVLHACLLTCIENGKKHHHLPYAERHPYRKVSQIVSVVFLVHIYKARMFKFRLKRKQSNLIPQLYKSSSCLN